MGRLVINGDEIYELDEECLREKKKQNCMKKQNLPEKKQNFQKLSVPGKMWRPQG